MTQIDLTLNGSPVTIEASGSLLDALRDLRLTSVKDGCAPQGQCGCCTVLVDGQPRVACVTPVERVSGRQVVTLEGLPEAAAWVDRFTSAGASQCGFCTPGIICRLAAVPDGQRTDAKVRQALLAHMCRCTGWQTIVEAAVSPRPASAPVEQGRDLDAAARRATIEGRATQRVDHTVAAGHPGFAADTAPPGSHIALSADDGSWTVANSTAAARAAVRRTPARRSTVPLSWPIDVPDGEWAATLQTAWVEPAAVELPSAWFDPASGASTGALANGGAFGAKSDGWIENEAEQLARRAGCSVVATLGREDAVRRGPKRPPLAIAERHDGSGVVVVARTAGIVEAIHSVAPEWDVIEVDIAGPSTSASLRGAGWAEVAAFRAARAAHATGGAAAWCDVAAPNRAVARARVIPPSADDGQINERVEVELSCGPLLDATVLRSYVIGAAHMALGMVRSEALRVGEDGVVIDMTMRSFGILRATETPTFDVVLIDQPDEEPVNGSDAVFAAVLAAAWLHSGFAPRWPTMRA